MLLFCVFIVVGICVSALLRLAINEFTGPETVFSTASRARRSAPCASFLSRC